MAGQLFGTEPPQRRAVRVFVSSTFRDLHAEREELVKRVFPQLRAVCEERGVAWSEVDLRWGITDEQKTEGRVLPICLAEIDNCRPYFIGLLGERYGWVPETLPPEVVEREPWLAALGGRSLTELEIVHGVLNDPAAAEHAYFYFRDPSYLDDVPPGDRDGFWESPTQAEVDRVGQQEAMRTAAARADMLARLKDRIRASGRPVVDGYRTPRELGDHVLRDLAAVLDRCFPPGSEPELLDQVADAQDALVAGLQRVYVPRQDQLDRLHAHATADGRPLFVVGPPGAGKSALLAHWAAHLETDTTPVIIRHFVSASSESRNWWVLVERILRELKNRLALPRAVPDDPRLLREALVEWLHAAAARSRVVLIIDGVDQLDDRDGAHELAWLPSELPPQVRLVVSAGSGRPLTVLRERGWPTLLVQPLGVEERTRLIRDHLGQAGKSLAPAQVRRIAAAEPCANPLYLRTLLEELRVYGDRETLDRRIDHYLAASTAEALYALILERYEQDYERDRPGLVREAFTLLWAARRGLAEAELLDLLGSDGAPLPSHDWSPLFLAARPAFGRTELLGFAHQSFRDGVRRRYLDSVDRQRAAHRRLADYFAFRPDPDPVRAGMAEAMYVAEGRAFDPAVGDRVAAVLFHPRRVQEHPWQLMKADEWSRLWELLADPIFLDHAYVSAPAASKADLLEYWAQVEAGSDLRLVDAYRPLAEAPETHTTSVLTAAAILLHDREHPAEALALTEHLARRSEAAGDLVGYAEALMEQALNTDDLGDTGGAVALCQRAEAILRRLDTRPAHLLLIACLNNLGIMLRRQFDPQRASDVLREAEELAKRVGDRELEASSLHNQAIILEARGDRRGAIALLQRDEQACREHGNLRAVGESLAVQARIFEQDSPDQARALLLEAEDIAHRLGLRGRQLHLVYDQAAILRRLGRTAEALEAFRAGERLARQHLDQRRRRQSLVHFLGNIGLLLVQHGDYDAACQAFDEQEATCREINDQYGLAATLGDRAFLHITLGEQNRALDLFAQQEQICRQIKHRRGLLLSLMQHAKLLRASGDPGQAVHRLREAADLARSVDDRERLDDCLASLIDILQELSAPEDIRPLFEERAQILRVPERRDDLQRVLVALVLLHRTWGEPDRSDTALHELELLARQHGDAAAVRRCAELRAMLGDVIEAAGSICLRANEHVKHGRLDQALEVYEQSLILYPDYVWGWSDMGICLLEMNRHSEAERALTKAVELGANDVSTWAPLGAARLQQGNLEDAWDCLQTCVQIDVDDLGTRRLAGMVHDYLLEIAATGEEDDTSLHELISQLRQVAGR
jgi:tetratricopeptide (TPR) repeat protein